VHDAASTGVPEAGQNAVVELVAYTGPWADDDPDQNFKADIATYAHVDPLSTITNLANAIDLPVGAVVHYVLAKWASEGSSGLLELGPRMARRLQQPVTAAEEIDTDVARLEAYHELRQLIEWLNIPLDQPDVY